MRRKCITTGHDFEISPLEQEYCRSHDVPLPSLSPEERLREMLLFRNRMYLYRAKCAYTGDEILSAIPPESNIPVYQTEVWESDVWSASDYALEMDFNRPFFEQFHELYIRVPRPNLGNGVGLENCDFTNGIARGKNCYLLFSSDSTEDCMFGRGVYRCRDVVDSLLVYDSEICFDCENIKESYNLVGCSHCGNCRDSFFLSNCRGCSDCFGCVNLHQKQFHWFNEPLSEPEYRNRLAATNLGSSKGYAQARKKFDEFAERFSIKAYFGTQNEDITGDFINNSKSVHNSYFISHSEDVENSLYLERAKNSIVHVNFGTRSELTYNCISVGEDSFNVKFSSDTWRGVRDLEYCINVRNGTHDCFGCVGLKKREYCILNKQYSKDEYFEMLPRVKAQMRASGEYGRFFPLSSSPNYYNRSDVEDFFPISEAEAKRRGFPWKDADGANVVGAAMPDDICEADDSVLSQVFRCEMTGAAYRLVRPELEFYRRYRLPLPRTAPLERLRARCRKFFQVKPLKEGNCAGCSAALSSCYIGGSRPLLCEDCFQKQVYVATSEN